jgi:hypothetical protein
MLLERYVEQQRRRRQSARLAVRRIPGLTATGVGGVLAAELTTTATGTREKI